MPLNLEHKKALVAEVNAVARAKAQSVVAAEYRGLTVSQMTELRAKARAQGVYMRVVKNTLARKALAGTAFETIGPAAQGPAGAGFLEGRSGRRRARGQGLREGQRQARRDSRVARRRRCCPARTSRSVANLPTRAAGAVDAARRDEGADPEARTHPRRAAAEAGTNASPRYATRNRPPRSASSTCS